MRTRRQQLNALEEPPIRLEGAQEVIVGSRAGLSVPVAMREVRQADLATIRDPGWLPDDHPARDQLLQLIEAEAKALGALHGLEGERKQDSHRRVTDPSGYGKSPRPDWSKQEITRREKVAECEGLCLARRPRS